MNLQEVLDRVEADIATQIAPLGSFEIKKGSCVTVEWLTPSKTVFSVIVKPYQAYPPGRPNYRLQGLNYKRLDVAFVSDYRGTFPKLKRYPFINERTPAKMRSKIAEFIKLMIQRHEQAEQEARTNRTESQKLKEKLKKRKDSKLQRAETFAKLMEEIRLGKIMGTVESALEDEVVNLTLQNNLKVKLQIESDGVLVTDLELNDSIPTSKLNNFVNQLGEIQS